MNRTIKFRGKCLETGEWVYGFYGHGLIEPPTEQFANFKSRIKKNEKGVPLYGSSDIIDWSDTHDNCERHYIMVWTLNLNGSTPHGYFTDHLVDPDTVGQYTGLNDLDGKDIYGDDLVELTLDVDMGGDPNERYYNIEVAEVSWEEKEGCWMAGDVHLATYVDDKDWERRCEVVGNRHDNPELIPKEQ